MKVDLKQEEIKSMFGKVKGYRVGMKVMLTQEEKAIIKNRNLSKAIAIEWEPDSPVGAINILMKDLDTQAWGRDFPSPVHAQAFMENLKKELATVKSFIDGAGRAENTSESFEL